MEPLPIQLLAKYMKEFSRKLEREAEYEIYDVDFDVEEEEEDGLGVKLNFKDYFDFNDPFHRHMKDFDDPQFCNFVLSFILESWRHNTWTQITLEGICQKIDITPDSPKFYRMVVSIFTALERSGHINFGLFKIIKAPTELKKRAIVIGAGISGIVVARQLKFFGFDVKILEATPRIGGRLHAFYQDDHFFDMGCSFISYFKENPILTVLKQMRLVVGDHKLTFLPSKIKLYVDALAVKKNRELAMQNLFLNMLAYSYKLVRKMGLVEVEYEAISIEELLQSLYALFELQVNENVIEKLQGIVRVLQSCEAYVRQLRVIFKKNIDPMKEYLIEDFKFKEQEPERNAEVEVEEVVVEDKTEDKTEENNNNNNDTPKQKLDDRDLSTFGIDDKKLMKVSFSQIFDNHLKFQESVELIDNYNKAYQKAEDLRADKMKNAEMALSIEEERILYWHFACLEYVLGGPLDDISLEHFFVHSKFKETSRQVYTPYSYLEILNRLSKDLDIQNNARVRRIQMHDDGVDVLVEQDEGFEKLSGDLVVCTVPLGVLKKSVERGDFPNKISFDPPLPKEKVTVIKEKLGTATINRVELHFENMFWDPADTLFGNVNLSNESRGEFFLIMSLFDSPVLSFFSCGKANELMSTVPDELIVSRCMNVLKELFEVQTTPNPKKRFTVPKPVAASVSHWDQNEFFMGSHTYPKVDAKQEDFDVMAQPLYYVADNEMAWSRTQRPHPEAKPKVYFAGEHTHRDFPGTVHGAFLSGLREVRNIVNHYCGNK